MNTGEPELSATVPAEMAGRRLDQALAEMFPDFSRSRLKAWILGGRVRLDGRAPRPRDRLCGGERIELNPAYEPVSSARAEDIPLVLAYEDEDLLVVDKPAGLVVHPGAGNPDGTLVNALLHHDASLARLPRAGLVHRLDKDTTGLLLVARKVAAHTRLVDALQQREIRREYEAVCAGVLTGGGRIDEPLGRHPVQRTRMSVRRDGRPAITHYRLLERYRAHSHLRLRLETGRTHQIRVHMAHLRHPLVGDPLYGRRPVLPPAASAELIGLLQGFGRQALHAAGLALTHPTSGAQMDWSSPLPADMRELIAALRADAAEDG